MIVDTPSICAKKGYLHWTVPPEQFRLLTPEANFATYTFNTGVAKHLFCGTCGIKSFYVPRSNPDGIDVNARCLDEGTVTRMTIEAFDGQNWEGTAKAYYDRLSPPSPRSALPGRHRAFAPARRTR